MFTEFVFEGIWWLPQKEGDQLTGKLKLSRDEGFTLELLGYFEEYKDSFRDKTNILGFTKNGKKITLIDCYLINREFMHPGIPSLIFSPSKVFVNMHANNNDDLKFIRVDFSLTFLDEWVNIQGFNINYNNRKLNAEYTLPETELIFENDKMKIYLDFYTKDFKINYEFQKKFAIEQFVLFRIDFQNEVEYSEVLEIINIISNLLHLIITKPIDTTKIYLVSKSNAEAFNLFNTYKTKIEFYYLQTSGKRYHDKISKLDILFTYLDKKEIMKDIFKKWFDSYDTLEMVYNLFFGTLLNDELFTNNKFLNLVQALESYHRRRYNGYELDKIQHQKRIDEIIENIPLQHKDWVTKKLVYSNEINLKKRIFEILKEQKSILDPYIKDIKSFSFKITNTRNYLAHFNKDIFENTYQRIDMHYAYIKLKVILVICFLKELGFNNEEIKTMIYKNKQYSFELMNMVM